MAYVDGDSLLVRIRLAFGANILADPSTWTWTDVTQYWHVPDPVDIGWGRSSGADQAETSTMSLTFKNTDSRFTAYDPRSPYWPHVKKWTPITYDIDLGDGVGWRNRYSGFVRKWPLTWPGRSPLMALAKIECVGILGRLGRGKPSDKSPLRRAITSPQHTGLLAYWPMEDEADSTQAASAIRGHPPLTATGTVEFAKLDPSASRGGTNRYGTKPLPELTLGGGLIGGVVPPGVTSPIAWTVQFLASGAAIESGPFGMVYWSWRAGGMVWEIGYMGPSVFDVALVVDGVTYLRHNSVYQSPYEWRLEAWQNGANINARLFIAGQTVGDVTPGGSSPWTASWPGTLDWPTDFASNSALLVPDPAVHLVGHLQVWDGVNGPAFYPRITNIYGDSRDSAWTAFRAESAHERLIRVCAEDSVTLECPPVSEDAATWMGPQPDGVPLALYGEVERTDLGLLSESGFGLGYLPRDARYNAAVALTVDASLGQLSMPFEPVDDDQALRNRWTVRRPGGSSETAEDRASIDSQGEFEASVDANVFDDSYLSDQASWRVHLTTVQEPRYPAVGINLGAHRELAAAWCDCLPGSRINIINPPEQNVPGTVDQIIVGGRETFNGRRSWKATMNTVPASPWQVAEADGEPRVAADGSTLAADLSADGPVSAGGSNPGFETGGTGAWFTSSGTLTASTDWAADGSSFSGKLTANGGGNPRATHSQSATIVAAGQPVRFSGWLYAPVALPSTASLSIQWYTAAGAFLSQNVLTGTLTPGVPTYLEGIFAAPALAERAARQFSMNGTPANGTLLYGDDIQVEILPTMLLASTAENGVWTTDPADFPLDIRVGGERVTLSAITGATSPQTATIAPGGRSIDRAWPAGTEVDVWHPAIAAL